MKIAAALALSALFAVGAALPAQAQQCPVGSYPSVDTWGNQVCKRFGDNSTATAQTPRGQQCPTGAHPAVDKWGNQICRTFDSPGQPRTDYYDTSKGCPAGTHEWVDQWGNKVCKPF
ncbi:hypothetical protein [Phenylobacterium soli]|uniref:hypothetical protein n=1 Tax=Phenylobacterium soli TaxID=2170551 RepID=UPI001057ED50|nr:hypothetical protein [Phenylobacterium soli]